MRIMILDRLIAVVVGVVDVGGDFKDWPGWGDESRQQNLARILTKSTNFDNELGPTIFTEWKNVVRRI